MRQSRRFPGRTLWAVVVLTVVAIPTQAQMAETNYGGVGHLGRIVPGIGYQRIQKLTGSLDLLFIKYRNFEAEAGNDVGLDVGEGGVKLRIGRAGGGGLGGGGLFLSALRTWGTPGTFASDATLLGPECHVYLFGAIALGLGYYFRVSGGGPSVGANLVGGLRLP